MRFGQNFHSHTVPEWDGLYIDYNRLKQLIKAPLVNDDAPEGVNHVQQSVIDALSRLSSAENALYLSLIELLSSSHLVTDFEPATASELLLRIFDSDVFRYTQAAILNLQSSFHKLRWFERVNHEAVDRIFAKLRKFRSHCGVDPDAVLSEWRQMQELVDTNRSTARRIMGSAIRNCRTSEESMASSPIIDTKAHLSYGLNSALVEAVMQDSPHALKDHLDQNQSLKPDYHRYIFKGLALRHKWQCLMMVASGFASILDHDCLAVLFYSLRVNSQHPPSASASENPADNLESVPRAVCELFSNEHEKISQILYQVGAMGRSPFHYAMENGFDISTAIRSALDERECHALLLDSMLSEDKEGLTPLHLATVGGHTSVVVSFFDILPVDVKRNKSHKVNTVAAECLSIAMRLGNDKLVEKLSGWADTKYIPAQGQSALHIAARAGRCDYIILLINAYGLGDLNLNITDSCGRTPLMDAGARGHISVVELLLKAGADPSLIDHSGWTARKYTVHRGHLEVAGLFPKPTNSPARRLVNSKATTLPNPPLNTALANADRDPTKHTLVIYLGGMQVTDNRSPVSLAGLPDEISPGLSVPKGRHLELSVKRLSAKPLAWRKQRQRISVNLPILEEQSSKPIIMQLDAETEPQLLIRLFENKLIDESSSSILGIGAVFLHNIKSLCGHQHESLVREHTIILLSPESQEPIGTVLLTYVIARPFEHLQAPVPTLNPASHDSGRMTIVGHRGSGMNSIDRSQLQLGENTLASFITAADHGAEFVELDAQVSRDLQTVIYHDFSLSETGTDIPIHELTIDQYKYASSIQTPHGSPLITPDEQTIIGKSAGVRRTRSFDGQRDTGALLIKDRLKHTVNFKLNAMKPNIRGDVIQDPLVTLPELFQTLPPGLGFNIEIKYARRHEARGIGVAPIALEINLFVDTVLEQVHRYASQRPIILSSFTPEICILLSMKQKAYPVLFITNAGKLPAIDFERRAASVQAGVHFAKTWGLAGIVFASEPLILCPELIGDVKRAGLICASYGTQNSIPENVLIQRDAGLDIIIVDKVALVAKTLKQ
ncbi:Glycerophosphoryl diester phosphodiesterase family-domain-containing protein [Xylaria curta]|nr:Glycerophosphoryl diester phosphodiesterase family-domain-containing protein [Xylaria curta]